ncbi:hypothetical protein D9V32_07350 [Mycetocola tolaasinivorans]|uniref:Lipoprotein n=1 Tax=Mycetocola tolaasinivorans TaxID=76635 RepID=A0A3L7A7X4_9MICO|nr:hypothetical protein [Mycetocola tolaasinivorans]RLP75968.1 hypothetical protein D9V32_07350 [Mycetocola tolaasinivorans]
MTRRTLVSIAILSVLLLSGCGVTPIASPPQEGEGTAPVARSKFQLDAMAAETVSVDDYRQSFARYSECLRVAGYSLDDRGETGQIIDYGVPEGAVDSGQDRECYEREFELVDRSWQLANRDSSAVIQLLIGCLVANQVEPQTTEDELYQQVIAAGIDPATCLSGASQ